MNAPVSAAALTSSSWSGNAAARFLAISFGAVHRRGNMLSLVAVQNNQTGALSDSTLCLRR